MLVLPKFSSEPWFKPEPSRTGPKVWFKVQKNQWTGPMVQFRVQRFSVLARRVRMCSNVSKLSSKIHTFIDCWPSHTDWPLISWLLTLWLQQPRPQYRPTLVISTLICPDGSFLMCDRTPKLTGVFSSFGILQVPGGESVSWWVLALFWRCLYVLMHQSEAFSMCKRTL